MVTRNLLIIDVSKLPWWKRLFRPDPWWEVGADITQFLHVFDQVVRVTSPQEVYSALNTLRPEKAQLWTHASPGKVFIGSRVLDPGHTSWASCKQVWFRSCGAAREKKGIAFMERVASHGVDVAAHLETIGALGHPSLVGVRAEKKAWWSPKTKAIPARKVDFWDMQLPEWAFHSR